MKFSTTLFAFGSLVVSGIAAPTLESREVDGQAIVGDAVTINNEILTLQYTIEILPSSGAQFVQLQEVVNAYDALSTVLVRSNSSIHNGFKDPITNVTEENNIVFYLNQIRVSTHNATATALNKTSLAIGHELKDQFTALKTKLGDWFTTVAGTLQEPFNTTALTFKNGTDEDLQQLVNFVSD